MSKPLPEMPKMRKIPKKSYAWAEDLLPDKYILFYKRKANTATITCSACGKTYTGRTGHDETLEQQAQRHIEIPYHNEKGRCALCKAVGIYKSEGRCRTEISCRESWITGQKMGSDYVFRAFTTTAQTRRGEKTEIEHCEYARIFLKKGKKPEKWYCWTDYWASGQPAWHPYNIGGMNNISIKRWFYDPYYKTELQKTWLKYGILRVGYDPLDYYEALSWHPALEMFQKSGMTELELQVIRGYSIHWNPRAKTPAGLLRIRKDRLKDLKDRRGERKYLLAYQEEYKSKRRWSEEEVQEHIYLEQFWHQKDKDAIAEVFKHATVKKLTDYLEIAQEAPRQLYIDYITMRMEEGYDLSNSVYLFPRNLRQEHDELVRQRETAKLDKRIQEAEERFAGIKQHYRKNAKRYSFESDGYLIRPAKCAGEIVMEGRLMHHCVGGDNYLEKHANGHSFILLMRRTEKPEEPYVTIEIKGKEIVQWYEAYDKKDHEEEIQPWLDSYIKHLEGKKNGRTRNKVSADI